MVRSDHGLAAAIGLVIIVAATSCAVPVAPTGGPVDKEPPTVATITPAGDAVNVPVDTRTIRFTFSEYMNEASFGQAFSISPEPVGPTKIRWRGRSVAITLPEILSENTTYVLTIDTRLKDVNGVSFANAKSFAFSTGETVSRGKISGRVLDATTGQPTKHVDIFAYPADDSVLSVLPPRARYRTQSGDSGKFVFDYLTPGRYVVAGVGDRNNNRKPDQLELIAIGDTLLTQATERETGFLTLYAFILDTLPPEYRRVQSPSTDRVAVRFSEAVYAETMEGWMVSDSSDGTSRTVLQAYLSADDPRDVILMTEPLQSTNRYRLILPAVADSAGNLSTPDSTFFRPGAGRDTTRTTLTGFFPAPNSGADSVSSFVPGDPFGFSLSQPMADGLPGHVSLSAANEELPLKTKTSNGRDFQLVVDPAISAAGQLRVELDGATVGSPDSTLSHYFQPLSDRELGSLSGTVGFDAPSGVIVEAYRSRERTIAGRAVPDSSGRFEFSPLRPGTYRIRAFRDLNRNGRWDGGRIAPLSKSEALLFTADTLSVKARWESVYPDTLRFDTALGGRSSEQ